MVMVLCSGRAGVELRQSYTVDGVSGFLFDLLATALSYARLNIDYPSNDAEYTWIRESFKVKDEDIKDEKDKVRNNVVDI